MRGRNFLWIFLVLILALSGCGDSSSSESSSGGDDGEGGGSADVNGTLTLPQAADGKAYWVAVDTDLDSGNGFTNAISGTLGAGLTQGYSIYNVPAGTYYLYAGVQNVSSSGPPVDGDFAGIYGGTLASRPSSPNASVPSSGSVTRDITLQVYSSSGGEPSGSTTVTGTLTLPAPVTGKTFWVAIDDDLDSGNGVQYSTTGTCFGNTVVYTINNVVAGEYYVYARVYVVSSPGDPLVDGDYAGIYDETPVASVPSSGSVTIDITMIICSGGGN